MQTITTQSLINKLANFNPASSFVTLSVRSLCGSKDFLKGKNGSRKALDKRAFQIWKAYDVKVQLGSNYATRYNNKMKKLQKEQKTEFRKPWYSMLSGTLAVKDSDASAYYIRGFETEKMSKTTYSDENGNRLTDKDLEPYRNPKKQSPKDLDINVFGIYTIEKITMLGETYLVE